MAAPSSHSASEASEAAIAPGSLLRQTENTSAHARHSTRPAHFPFLSLPAEIRLMVYECLLVFPDDGNIQIVPDPRGTVHDYIAHWDSNVSANLALNVLLVSKQVYGEAAKVFYSENKFDFGAWQQICRGPIFACQAFLNDRSLITLKYIRSIEIVIVLSNLSMDRDSADDLRPLINILNFSLPAFEHLTLNFYGLSPDVRRAPWRWPSTDSSPPEKWLGVLLELRKVKSLHIYHNSWEPIVYSTRVEGVLEAYRKRLGCMVAFASFLRAHLLKNADGLGNQNIHAHHRHWASFTLNRWKRKVERVGVVECHDDENGTSFLEPVARLVPREIGILEKYRIAQLNNLATDLFNENRIGLFEASDRPGEFDDDYEETGVSDVEDWDMDDGEDEDSLNGDALSNTNTTFVRDEQYLKSYEQIRGRY